MGKKIKSKMTYKRGIKKMHYGIRSFFLLLVFLVITGASCEKDELRDQIVTDTAEAYVMDINVPEKVIAGEPAIFIVNYYKPTPCYDLKDILVKGRGFELYLKVLVENPVPGQVCPQVLVEGSKSFSYTFEKPGTYTLDFNPVSANHRPVKIKVEPAV